MTEMRITDGKGVHFTFENGVTISIQIGGGNYGDNYDFPIGGISHDNPLPPSTKAEVAAWDDAGEWFTIEGGQVAGYIPIATVLDFMGHLRDLPNGVKAHAIGLDGQPSIAAAEQSEASS